MADVIYLTKEWLKKLEEELKYLKSTKRLEIAEKLKEAISFWDLSESAEYEDARNEQAQVEVRIADLEEQLKRVEIIEEKKSKWNTVNIGSIVSILSISENQEYEYKIVWTTEANILDEKEAKISNESPVWSAILWKRKWDVVKVKAPAGVYEFKIIKIS